MFRIIVSYFQPYMIDLTNEETIRIINIRLWEFIENYRKTHDLTVDEFEAKVGCGQRYIYRIDMGAKNNTRRPYPRDIRIGTFIKFARLLDMTVDDFLQYLLYEKNTKN